MRIERIMTIKLVLYGDLKSKVDDIDEKMGSVGAVELETEDLDHISDILARFDIDQEEVSHIFLNRDYSNIERKVEDGDRLALFPRDMALLYKWYFNAED